MRVVLAFLVLGWVVNLIVAMASGNTPSIVFAALYLFACAYGAFARGWFLGLALWIAIGVGVAVLARVAHTTVAPVTLLVILFWSGIAIVAGNLFRRE